MKILVSGSRGFLGGVVGRNAAGRGHEVLGLGRASQPGEHWSGAYLQTDVTSSDLSTVLRDFQPDVVLHAAGTASVSASLALPLDDLRASLLTWANMLDSVRRSQLKPLLLFPSSAAVYGSATDSPLTEGAPLKPLSPYGFHKLACELLAQEYAQCFDLRIVICRLFSVFGPTQHRLLIWELFQQAKAETKTVSLSGSGRETRDYLHSDDVATALLALAASLNENLPAGKCEIVNVASGEEIAVHDVARRVVELVSPGKSIETRGEARRGDPFTWRADLSHLRSLIPHWKPKNFDQQLSSCLKIWEQQFQSG